MPAAAYIDVVLQLWSSPGPVQSNASFNRRLHKAAALARRYPRPGGIRDMWSAVRVHMAVYDPGGHDLEENWFHVDVVALVYGERGPRETSDSWLERYLVELDFVMERNNKTVAKACAPVARMIQRILDLRHDEVVRARDIQ